MFQQIQSLVLSTPNNTPTVFTGAFASLLVGLTLPSDGISSDLGAINSGLTATYQVYCKMTRRQAVWFTISNSAYPGTLKGKRRLHRCGLYPYLGNGFGRKEQGR